jgi:type IV secretory pathway protease TraF
MTRPQLLNARGKTFALACIGVMGLGVMAGHLPPVFLINESPSLPRGLYVWIKGRSPTITDTVALPQPPAARPYLNRLEMPADVLLIKRVVARSGDRVCRVGNHVELSGRRVRVVERDRSGVRLASWQGCRRLAPGEVFLLGDTQTSFDSRYFGPVDTDNLTGTYREILRW